MASRRLLAVDGEAHDHDAAGNTISIGGKAFQPLQRAIWLDNYPVALINAPSAGVPEVAYVQPDHLGTPRVAVDPVRDVAIWEWSSKSEVFGNQVPNVAADGDGVGFELALRFPGQQATDASGMFYNYQRDYDPAVGRYSQSDPIGLAGDISTYGYVSGDPLSKSDPSGLDSIVTYQNLGQTVYLDSNGNVVKSWDSLSSVARSAKPGAAGPYESADVYPTSGPYKNNPRAFGPNDILKTDDARGRWIHGGGSGLFNPLAPRQGWRPAVGCTRMQNEDIQELVDMVRERKQGGSPERIRYQRLDYVSPTIVPFFLK